MTAKEPIWIMRELSRCSGCRMCEIACSLHHEGKIWPEASRVRVFMLVPGADFPHLCTQCHDYPCVEACPVKALSVEKLTSAVLVDREKCTSCMSCISACPGRIPFLHPGDNKATICNLCGGDPECAKICQEGNWDVLRVVERTKEHSYKLYAKRPEEVTRELVTIIYGERGKELI
ncbi:MAG: 4Fe-4S dicluster domain-containing protein [Candidatus Bathyarchaeota archaeon]|jgi:Fe-S-cluster-containing hydrogenase component 2|nr:4Fe-4S dicluster domain-containing protein [Candidatus Bathyarchaeota archaeon]